MYAYAVTILDAGRVPKAWLLTIAYIQQNEWSDYVRQEHIPVSVDNQ